MKQIVIRSHYKETQGKLEVKEVRKYEKIDPVSMTIQGETMTIKQLLERAQNGMPIGVKPLEYLDAEDLDSVSRFHRPIVDITDLDELREEADALRFQLEKAQEAYEKLKTEDKDKFDKKPIDPDQTELFEEAKIEDSTEDDKPKKK